MHVDLWSNFYNLKVQILWKFLMDLAKYRINDMSVLYVFSSPCIHLFYLERWSSKNLFNNWYICYNWTRLLFYGESHENMFLLLNADFQIASYNVSFILMSRENTMTIKQYRSHRLFNLANHTLVKFFSPKI